MRILVILMRAASAVAALVSAFCAINGYYSQAAYNVGCTIYLELMAQSLEAEK